MICLKLQFCKQFSETGGQFLALRKLYSLFLDFFCCHVVQSLHAQRQFAVFDGDDFYFDFISDSKYGRRMLNTLLADLGNMYQAAQPVAQGDKCSVRLQTFDSSLCDKAYLYVGNLGFSLFLGLFAQNFLCR